jgi:hypothetical protein
MGDIMSDVKVFVRNQDGITLDMVSKSELKEGLKNGSIVESHEVVYREDELGTARPVPHEFYQRK